MGAGESRLAVSEALIQLEEQQNPIEDGHTAISSLLDSSLSSEELFALVSLSSIRSIAKSHQQNICNILDGCLHELDVFLAAFKADEIDNCSPTRALNAVRLITRITPVLYELAATDEALLGYIHGGFAVRAVDAVLTALFLPGWTCGVMKNPGKPDAQTGIVGACLWAGGLVSQAPKAPPAAVPARTDLLRALLALLSIDIYKKAPATIVPSLPIAHFNSVSSPNGFLFLISTLNVIAGLQPDAGIPYVGAISTTQQQLATQARLAIDVLSITLASCPSGKPHRAPGKRRQRVADASEDEDNEPTNVLAFHLKHITAPDALSFIFEGISKLTANPADVTGAFMPGAHFKITFVPELAVLLTIMIRNNPDFAAYISTCRRIDPFVRGLIHLVVSLMADKPSDDFTVGSIYTVTNLLVTLSTNRSFAVALGQKLSKAIRIAGFTFSAKDTLFDIAVFVMAQVVVMYHARVPALAINAALFLSNSTPYMQTLSPTVAVSLKDFVVVALSEDLTKITPTGKTIAVCAIETMNNVIHHQFAGNSAFILELIRSQSKFARMIDAARRVQDRGTDPSDLNRWLASLHVGSIVTALKVLTPHVTELQRHGVRDPKIREMLSGSTLIGLLPIAPQLVVRSGENSSAAVWLRGYSWSLALHQWDDVPMFDLATVMFFKR
ncbi:High-temperature-induced dauer-formation protein [Carpediemonas membranifera]|uniref:High-temperature-induced dauer-formation protein n=1 Tax=Carpediemonas membranifera TaxID=201153 RepID=A0A8J6AQR7_9EUKA|nr:High-temperature-induced dauer-formation protein [Carpediemonas membranifera]|eukprot:KAG9391801.1 High-temperature-induced dauer-formation protein [Carpediemonas membranifera]